MGIFASWRQSTKLFLCEPLADQKQTKNMISEDTIGVGSFLGGFKIERELGRGGMGVVYKAHELSLNRKVALKVLSQRLSSDEEFIKRFQREAQVIAVLNHPNIVNILSCGKERGLYYFAMEYVKGKDLGQILKEKTSIPLEQALSITSQVASALGEAGERGVVHRDIKPPNIMIDEMGRAKVTDFGVAHLENSDAKLTRTGLFLGTPEYASPEHATGRPLDVRSDIYSLGAVLYRMLSGKSPVTGESPLAVMTKLATEPVTPISQLNSSVPKPVCALIEKMMAKEPNERFQTPKEILVAIDDCIDSLKLDAPLAKSKIQGVGTMPASTPKSRSYAKLFGGIAGVALAVFLIVWLVKGWLPKEKLSTAPTKPMEKAQVLEEVPAKLADIKPVPKETAPTSAPVSEVKEAETAVMEKLAGKSAELKKDPVLPKIPTVLMSVSGDESMVPLVQAHLESIIVGSGLRIASILEIPMLKEKMQFGEIPITWYSIKEFIPKNRAHIFLLAKVRKTGSMPLEYYGYTQELTTAFFSIRTFDMATGTSAGSPASASVRFTPLNMEENFKEAITSAASGIGTDIKTYWKEKLSAVTNQSKLSRRR